MQDDGKIVGVYKEYVNKMKRDFSNLCNNPEKINPTIYLKMKEYEIDNKVILHVYVPEILKILKLQNYLKK